MPFNSGNCFLPLKVPQIGKIGMTLLVKHHALESPSSWPVSHSKKKKKSATNPWDLATL